ncbi:MAG: GGDEF domain-containing protein [Candidatus Obscuribacterales bacterium]|nr:GGDEF domain-containing protein [Steroidobacteraceae bacterium]
MFRPSASTSQPATSRQAAGWAEAWAGVRQRAGRVHLDVATEREFREWYKHYVRPRVRSALWLPMATLLLVLLGPGPFNTLRDIWFGSEPPLALQIVGFGIVLPSTLAILTITYTSLYDRFYAVAAQIVCPLHGACFIAMDVMMRPNGYSLGSWLVLVLLGSYFSYGMLVHQGIRSALLMLSTYVAIGLMSGLDSVQWRMDLAAITFASTFSGYLFYMLHQAVRANYLERRNMHDRIHRDALTGIYNRRMFDEHIERLWQQALRERAVLGLLIVDIDHFKDYNDSLGHQAGDDCLAKIAKLLATGARRPLDITARYGGEEFAILLYGTDRGSIEELSQQLQAAIAAAALPHPASPVKPYVTISVGGACVIPAVGRSQYGFIQLADEALYAAKERGRNRVVIMDREYETLRTGAFRSYKAANDVAA